MTRRVGKRLIRNKEQTRRDFLKNITRLGLGGALGMLGLSLLGKVRSDRSKLTLCTNNYYCRACGLSTGCNLPQALSFRKRFKG